MDIFFPKHWITRACLSVALPLLFRIGVSAADSALEVVNAGVQTADNDALAAHDYQFMPGDPLFVVFEIEGYGTKLDGEKDTRSISLQWAISVVDVDDTPLAPAQNGDINTGLNPEDKKWLPRRRAEFVLPRLVAAGEYRVHIAVKDLLKNTQAVRDIPFLIGGDKLDPSQDLGIQQLHFSRQEGGPDLEVPAYRPGDSVFLRFDITGFAETPEHEYRVSYRFDVLGPDGKPFVKQSQAIGLTDKTFYPAKFVPVSFSIETPAGSARGEYTVVLNVSDGVSNQSSTVKRTFTLE